MPRSGSLRSTASAAGRARFCRIWCGSPVASPTVGRAKYGEGDWFAVPLPIGLNALGVVARVGRAGVLFGYFFGPARHTMPSIADVGELDASKAALIGKFGHLGLEGGRWPLLGSVNEWNPDEWPMRSRVVVSAGGRDSDNVVRERCHSAVPGCERSLTVAAVRLATRSRLAVNSAISHHTRPRGNRSNERGLSTRNRQLPTARCVAQGVCWPV
jgi:hypothetical protein